MIRYADAADLETLAGLDRHISREELARSVSQNRVLVALDGDVLAGWLRYNLFWDNTPFMNMLFIGEGRRGQGLGGQLTGFWEREMKAQGYSSVLTSTLSNEDAQHFYRKHGYTDCGGLLLPGEPLELFFIKGL